MTVIDGATNDTLLVPVAPGPYAVGVNPVTNRIYVACYNSACVAVIDGADNDTTVIRTGDAPSFVAVNTVTDRIYVAHYDHDVVSVIDGATNDVVSIPVGGRPKDLSVDPVTNQVFVANAYDGTVTIIDGATNSTTSVAAGVSSWAVAVNPVTGKVYIADYSSYLVSMFDARPNVDTRVRTVMLPLPGCTTSLAQPQLTGRAVNRWTPFRTNILGVMNRAATAQLPWNWAQVSGYSDSVQWAWNWGTDSLMMGENYVCCIPLEDQAVTTNNLGLGTPFAGNLEVYPVYRMEYHVGQQERTKLRGQRSNGPTIVRGVLVLGAVDSRQNTELRAELLDVSGREVLDLRPGANDVNRLAPGVYFMWEQPKLDSHAGTVRVVVLIK